MLLLNMEQFYLETLISNRQKSGLRLSINLDSNNCNLKYYIILNITLHKLINF
jgi:hypothetical protein